MNLRPAASVHVMFLTYMKWLSFDASEMQSEKAVSLSIILVPKPKRARLWLMGSRVIKRADPPRHLFVRS